MAINTLQDVFDLARVHLHDIQAPGGETYTNQMLQGNFAEPYRRMFNCLMGVSKRVQRTVYVNLPASTTVLIPSSYNITDFSEPEIIEERQAASAITIVSTTAASPIVVNAPSHGLGAAPNIVECVVSGVAVTPAPWGRWFGTIIDADNLSLNGSVGDVAGTGGVLSPWLQTKFSEVAPLDQEQQGLDGQPQQFLEVYKWSDGRLQFRGSNSVQQLRITYWASGSPPVIASTPINIDDSINFLACATAANAARASGWYALADQLKFTAFGQSQTADCVGGLLGEFVKIQVLTMQRGPQRRREPFRQKRSRFGNAVLG